jgi:hypothetical protein
VRNSVRGGEGEGEVLLLGQGLSIKTGSRNTALIALSEWAYLAGGEVSCGFVATSKSGDDTKIETSILTPVLTRCIV